MGIEKGRALHWFIQRITGLVLGFGVMYHFLMFHYFGYKIGLTYLEARERLISPGWITFYSVLLGMAIFHGMNGLWGVFLDYNLPWRSKKLIKFILYILGFFLFIVGGLILIRFNIVILYET
jgi:succinate dehydrogenase / fumarate reductase, membrane anchor subunit